MKILWTGILLLIVTACSAEENKPSEMEIFMEESNRQISNLAMSLKTHLVAAMQEGGPGKAIEVCNVEAPIITNEINSQSDVQIKRTSLKIRNPNNAPDEWEEKVLTDFEDQLKNGISIDKLNYSEVSEDNGVKTYRMMRAIPVGNVCVVCHGPKDLLPDVVQKELAAKYPNDQATGYSVGGLRGAFSLTKTIQ